MKAMLLAAGRGARMRPLTDTTPKALLSVGPHRLIEYNLLKLSARGIKELVINVSYLAPQIVKTIGNGSAYGLTITYSYEPDSCLGTGGGVFQALPFFKDEPFILVSADIWSDVDYAALSLPEGKEAHLVLVENPAYHSRGDYGLSPEGDLDFSSPLMTYSGISVIHPQLFAGCQPQAFSLSPLFNQAIERGCASGNLHTGRWFNVGTPEQLQLLTETLT